MTPIKEVLERATPFVRPSPGQAARIGKLADSLLRKVNVEAAKFSETRGALLGGSFAKGTWIPKYVDLDIFVRFDPSVPKDRFEVVGLAIGAAATRGHPRGKKYAEHPYTEAVVNGVRVNIVPCYAVEPRMWKSAADRSPFHVDLIKGLPEETKTQIRLLKSFMKAVGVYGAEIQTQGFSGYVAEVLTMKHRNLEGVLRWFADFQTANEERMFHLPDPVDEGRDLAIAVSSEKLGRMVLASRAFLRSPRRAYFVSVAGKERPAMKQAVVALVFSHKRLSEDTLWGELRRTMKHIARHLEVNGFKLARSIAASNNLDRSAILFIPELADLPELEQRMGPTVDRRKDVEAFLDSGRASSRLIWVDDDARVRFLRARRYRKVSDFLQDLSKGRAGPVGASRELEKAMRKSAVVLEGKSLERAARSSPWLMDGVDEITTDALGTRAT
ncbi:MAG TPA: CCA tRNA nucleotidyltransferase [Nitrososphaerales archaeon]|nr:CCA tRNA nucleotidyltransferase [Nitrososphaerales archaeon]